MRAHLAHALHLPGLQAAQVPQLDQVVAGAGSHQDTADGGIINNMLNDPILTLSIK